MNDRTDNPGSRPPVLVATPSSNGPTLSDRVRSLRLDDQINADRAPNLRLPWVLCAILAMATAFLGLVVAFRPVAATDDKPAADVGLTVLPGTPRAATKVAGQIVLESKGYIIPAHQIQVSPKIAGMVVDLFIEEGKRVKEGEVLAVLEAVEYQARRDASKGRLDAAKHRLAEIETAWPEEVKQARAELDECEAQRDQYRLELNRNSGLRTGQAVAQREFEQAESQYRTYARRAERLRIAYELVQGPRKLKIDSARAELRQAEADLFEAQWRLDNCTVRAPVTGTILTKKAEKGNIVNPIAFNISASLCEMADLSDLEVDLNIQERDLAKVRKGQKCVVRVDAFPDKPYDGVVDRLMPTADRAKGAVPVRVKVKVPRDEEGVYLKPEMGAVVTFLE